MLSKVQIERKPSFSVITCGELQDKLEMRDEMPSYIVNAVAVKGHDVRSILIWHLIFTYSAIFTGFIGL